MRYVSFVLLPLALLVGGCGSSASSTTPSSTHAVETFTGTLQPLGTDVHDFTQGISGEVTITLTSAGPQAGISLGMGFGLPNGAACTLQVAQIVSPANIAQITGSTDPGAYCVSVYDTGTLTAPASYTVVVSHF